MKNNKLKKTAPEQSDAEAPSWVTEPPRRTTPHTEEEFGFLVDGTIEGIEDTAAWKDLVRRVGLHETRRALHMTEELTRTIGDHFSMFDKHVYI